MKALINGILYDTEKAYLLGAWNINYASVDGVDIPNRLSLYRGKNGNYFKTKLYTGKKSWILRCLTGTLPAEELHFYPLSKDEARQIAFDYGLDLKTCGFEPPRPA